MIPPIWRDAGAFALFFRFAYASTTSRYFNPDPVLNKTTVSSGVKNPFARNFRYATRDAAPSGAAKTPSIRAHCR